MSFVIYGFYVSLHIQYLEIHSMNLSTLQEYQFFILNYQYEAPIHLNQQVMRFFLLIHTHYVSLLSLNILYEFFLKIQLFSILSLKNSFKSLKWFQSSRTLQIIHCKNQVIYPQFVQLYVKLQNPSSSRLMNRIRIPGNTR